MNAVTPIIAPKSNARVNATRLAHSIRLLAADAVEKAKSGHPGMPMGMAEIAVALWTRHLRHNPRDPGWPDRDRFVISNGHGSMLQYALLHLTGYDLPITELQRFRQLHSKTPGHPEVGITPGVETTTEPLGPGLGLSAGHAAANRSTSAGTGRRWRSRHSARCAAQIRSAAPAATGSTSAPRHESTRSASPPRSRRPTPVSPSEPANSRSASSTWVRAYANSKSASRRSTPAERHRRARQNSAMPKKA